MADKVVNISLQADIRQLREALAQLPNIGDKEAGKMVRALQAQYKKAEAAAKASAKASEKEWERGLDGIKGIAEKSAGMLGGVFGDLGNIVFDVGGKLSVAGGAVGAVGIAAGGAVAGVIALGMASKALADSAIEARDRLTEQGLAAMLPSDALASLQDYEEANKDLRREVDLLTVAIGSEFAPALTDAAHATVGLIDALGSVASGAKAVYDAFEPIRSVTSWIDPTAWEMWALNKAYGALVDQGEEHVAQTKEEVKAVVSLQDQEKARIAAMVEHGKAETEFEKKKEAAGKAGIARAKAVADAEREAAEAARKAADALDAKNDALAKIGDVANEAYSDLLTDEQKVLQAYDARIAKITEAAVLADDYWAAEAAQAEAADRRDRDLHALRVDQLKELADLQLEVDDLLAEAQNDAKERGAEVTSNWSHGLGAVADGLGSITSMVQANADAMAEAAENGTKAEKDAAKAAFRRAKALALATAVVQAASATLSLIPSFAYLGPGAPVAAAAVSAAALAAQVAAIQNQKPPSFERGGLVLGGPSGATPDHVSADVQPGEYIATKHDVQRNGGPRGVEQALRGGRERPVLVRLALNGRDVAEAMWDPLGSLVPGSTPLGRRVAYR
jgi:hypothetical protein